MPTQRAAARRRGAHLRGAQERQEGAQVLLALLLEAPSIELRVPLRDKVERQGALDLDSGAGQVLGGSGGAQRRCATASELLSSPLDEISRRRAVRRGPR